MYFGHGTGGYKLTRGDVWCSSGAICWRMCQHWAHGLFCVCVCVCVCVRAGKPPAGPVCGITPQDPSRAGSQKRKQLSDNELLFCDQTSAFLRSGWGSWERVKNHTHARLYTRCTHTYCMHTCAYSEALHTHIKEATLTTRWTTYPIWTEPVKPAIIYTSQGHILYTNCTEPTQHKHNKIQSSPHTYKHPCVQCHLKILRFGGNGRKKKPQTFQKCFSFSGEGSKRSVRLTLAAAWLRNANSAHPQTDPCEPSRQLSHSYPWACRPQCCLSLTHDCEPGLRLNGLTAQRRLLEELAWRAQCVMHVCVLELNRLSTMWARSGYHALWGVTCVEEGEKLFFRGKRRKTLHSWQVFWMYLGFDRKMEISRSFSQQTFWLVRKSPSVTEASQVMFSPDWNKARLRQEETSQHGCIRSLFMPSLFLFTLRFNSGIFFQIQSL